MSYNSTIRQKTGFCEMCPESKGKQPLIKGLCQNHYWNQVRLKSVEKQSEKEIKAEGLSDLIDILDAVFARWVKLAAADENGWVACFVTGRMFKVNDIDAGHFISRGCMYLRWDPRNVKPQSKVSNQLKDGDRAKFAMALEKESPGIVEILEEESHIPTHLSRQEINSIIVEYRAKNKTLESKIIL